MNKFDIDQLLMEGESNTLDYKEIEYKINSDIEKGEFIKDILSFINAWRRTDAYILLGVKEIPGEKSEVVGIKDIIDDATLQQIVNSKTNKPVNFSYKVINYKDKKIGIIHIPDQDKPIYLKKNFGNLLKETVYIRRGTSTSISSPDEISKMGKENNYNANNVDINLEFSELNKHNKLGNYITLKTVLLNPLQVTDIKEEKKDINKKGYFTTDLMGRFENLHYEADLINYLKNISYVGSIGFVLTNNSNVTLNNVECSFKIFKNDGLIIYCEDLYPKKPEKYHDNVASIFSSNDDIEVNNYENRYEINLKFNKILPKKEIWSTDSLFLGINKSKKIEVECYIYSEELPNPIIKKITFEFIVENKDMTVEDVFNYEKENELQKYAEQHLTDNKSPRP